MIAWLMLLQLVCSWSEPGRARLLPSYLPIVSTSAGASPSQPPAGPALPRASMVEWTGHESWAEALKVLNQTGNVVIDARANRGQSITVPTLKLKPGKQSFWAALDEMCAQAQLSMVQSEGRIELVTSEGPRTQWIAYDGPWRARIVRRSLIAFDDPTLDRLLCQVELSLEPKFQPLLFTLNNTTMQWLDTTKQIPGSRGTQSFDGEPTKTLEVRLPLPLRSVASLNSLTLEGTAWLAPGRLTFTLPLLVQPGQTKDRTTFTINQIDVNQVSKTWELTTELQYPEGSLDFESHQSRLLSSMKLILTNGKEKRADIGHDIRTDTGRRVSARWLFPAVPGDSTKWNAVLTAPAAPQQMGVKLVFEKVMLP